MGPTLETRRLILRPWRSEDTDPFAAMNADPRVMEHFPRPATREETVATIDRCMRHFAARGFGPWAIEVKGGAPFIGFAGLLTPAFEAHFTPCVEIGWRLAAEHWGFGYATEAAAEALRFGFENAGLEEIVSFTVPANVRSRAVMERLGMRHDAEGDFDHPKVAEGSPLRRHVLYRLQRAEWASKPGPPR